MTILSIGNTARCPSAIGCHITYHDACL